MYNTIVNNSVRDGNVPIFFLITVETTCRKLYSYCWILPCFCFLARLSPAERILGEDEYLVTATRHAGLMNNKHLEFYLRKNDRVVKLN